MFLVTGAWHGSQFSFLFWGMWHGFFVIVERFISRHMIFQVKNRIFATIKNILSWAYTSLVVMLGWILFSITDLAEAFEYVGVMFGVVKYDYIAYEISYFISTRLILIIVIACLLCIPHKNIWQKMKAHIKNAELLKYVCVILLLVVCFIKIVNAQYSPFIYFRF